MASRTCLGFCELAAESRNASGRPWKVWSKIGKSARRRWASTFVADVTATALLYPRARGRQAGRTVALDGRRRAAQRRDGVCAAAHAELLVDVREVELHRALGHPEPLRDLAVPEARGKQSAHLELARGHALDDVTGRARHV